MFTVNHCGFDSRHLNPCDIEHKNGLPEYLLLIVKSEAWFILDRKRTVVQPNMLILFEPMTYIHYGCTSNYNDDWIRFHMDEAGRKMLIDLEIPFHRPLYPAQIHLLSSNIQLLTNTSHSNLYHRHEIQDYILRTFFYLLDSEIKKTGDTIFCHKFYSAFSHLRTRIYNTPSLPWSVTAAADSLCLSISYFQHLYKEFFNCSLQQDIIKARLTLAKFYLSNSSMTIRNLSELCGYDNETHFMRQFKKYENVTPSIYRKKCTFIIEK